MTQACFAVETLYVVSLSSDEISLIEIRIFVCVFKLIRKVTSHISHSIHYRKVVLYHLSTVQRLTKDAIFYAGLQSFVLSSQDLRFTITILLLIS